jgi:hypothetical protein
MQWENTKACEHFVQFYEDDASIIESVAAFIGASLASGVLESSSPQRCIERRSKRL